MKAPPAAACLFIACLSAVALGEGADAPRDGHRGDDRGIHARPKIVARATAEAAQIQSPPDGYRDHSCHSSEWWETASHIATTAGAFVGAVGLVFLIINVRDTGKAARAAKVSADAANESILVAKKALLSERPYLVIESATLTDYDGSLQMEFKVKNYGKGPALFDSIRAELLTLEGRTQARPLLPNYLPSPPYAECVPILPLPLRVLDPGDVATFKTNTRPSSVDRADIATGKNQPVGFGRIDYRDIFGSEWETGFLWLFWAGNLEAFGPEWAFDTVREGPRDRNYTVGPRDPQGEGGPWSFKNNR